MKRTVLFWLAVGLASFALLPWHMTRGGVLSFEWAIADDPATGLWLAMSGTWWLIPVVVAFIGALCIQFIVPEPVKRAKATRAIAGAGLVWTALQGLAVVRSGPRVFEGVLTGDMITAGQPGMGLGAGLCLFALLFVFTISMSQTGKGRGDAFVVSVIGLIVALVGVF
ncbi:MAG: hypothetical protein QNK92_08425, partial [Amylibacter sp.]